MIPGRLPFDGSLLPAGISIGVLWHVPNGMERRPSDPQILTAAVKRAFDAGADGALGSGEYDEMWLSNVEEFGHGVRHLTDSKLPVNQK